MKPVELKPGIYWVGGIDWNLRNFHGYLTQRGSTYNAYLIIDKHITIIDTVKHYLFDEMISRIREIIDPSQIKYIVSNHVEMDHSGSISRILDLAPEATIITSTRGEKGLQRHYKEKWNMHPINSGDRLNIGKRTLQFVHIPMVHWPDSMVTYSPVDKILFPNDAFGQHLASSERFDDELPWGILYEEAAKYYANIVMPYGTQVEKALTTIADLDFDMIAPSHGIIWRTHLEEIIEEYKKWAKNESKEEAVIVYDTMWGSTEQLAYALQDGLNEEGLPVKMRNLNRTHISDVITDVLQAKLILIGSPTLNNGMMPTIGGFLTYLKGLRPRNKVGFVFGSYGWGGQAVSEIEQMLKDLSWELPEKSINIQYIPDKKELQNIREIGKRLVKYVQKEGVKS